MADNARIFDHLMTGVLGYSSYMAAGGDWGALVTSYLGIPVYLILIAGHKLWTKSKGVRPHECDFYTGKDIIDREEEAFLAAKAISDAEKGSGGASSFYRKYVSWLL